VSSTNWALRAGRRRRQSGRGAGRAFARSILGLASVWSFAACNLLDLTHWDTSGGRVLWQVPDVAARGQPAFDGETAFFTSTQHRVVAVNAETGAIVWTAETGGPFAGTNSDAGCVIAADLVACGDDDIVAFKRTDGTLVWRYHATIGFGPGFFPFRYRRGVIFASSQGSGTLYAIDATTGAELWAKQAIVDTAGTNVFGVSVDDDIVAAAFITGDKPIQGGVTALDPKTGAVRWTTYFPIGTFDAPGGGFDCALWSDVVLGSSLDGSVYAFDRQTGATRFVVPPIQVMSPQRGDFRPIAVVGSTLFSIGTAERFTAYDLNRRVEFWRVTAPGGSSSGEPMAADDVAAFEVQAGGHLVAYSVSGRRVLWDFGNIRTPFVGTAAIGPDRVFIGGTTGFWALSR
jgi:outer membrane protein assembly factor BamB